MGHCAGVGRCQVLVVLVAAALAACATPRDPYPVVVVSARGETVPVGTIAADAADDPAIWRNAADPQASLVVGTDKKAGLYVYGLDGGVRHFLDAGAVNNVDLLEAVPMPGGPGVLVVASDRNDPLQARLALFRLEVPAGTLVPLGSVPAGAGEAYGVCLYRRGDTLHAFSVLKDGSIHQVELHWRGGLPQGRIVRSFRLATQAEGCAVDARSGRLYVAEEDVGLWRFDATPDGSTEPVAVAGVDRRRLVADAEGVAVVPEGDRGGYLVLSSQGDNAYAVYALPGEQFIGRFRIAAGRHGSVEETDGLDVVAGDFGPQFPGGLLVVQDGVNTPAAQNFKLLAWQDVLDGLTRDRQAQRRWLAGDHHIHSEFSADYEPVPGDPLAMPTPVFGGDARYGIVHNARMAARHGLRWMVSTDHGGPGHSRISHDHVHPAVQAARREVPQVVHFFGMEFDTPAGEHSSLIIPQGPAERRQLFELEAGWSRRDAHPDDKSRDTEQRMHAALDHMRAQDRPPLLIANHPSRSAASEQRYGRYDPAELRRWNDRAPLVAIGMEGAPGHQASALRPDGSLDAEGQRGGYKTTPTRGGFDPMTARVGGFWDAMLAEGRRWWITATSDSHQHWRDGGNDFWPGEYSKTWVEAMPAADDIFDGLRAGRVFVSTGDLVTGIDLQASVGGRAPQPLSLGATLAVAPGETVTLQLRVRDPAAANHHGDHPMLQRLDAVVGSVTGPAADAATDRHPTARVLRRFDATQWQRDGEWISVQLPLGPVTAAQYLRWRGTNTDELEPEQDPAGEDPWTDLWFYTNPVFIVPTAAGVHSPD